MKKWSNNLRTYKLSDEYSIVMANPSEFAIYDSIYGDNIKNRFAVKHWDLRLAISLDNPFAKYENFYWIEKEGKKIGGVMIEPNVISRLFIIPPFTDMFLIVKLLKKLLIHWSNLNKKIYAYQIPKEQYSYFEMLGFWSDKKRRWMMRPTETFDIMWDETLVVKRPTLNKKEDIARLYYDCFSSNIDSMYNAKQDGKQIGYKTYLEQVNDYFKNCTNDIVLEASTVIYSEHENKLIGACLISIFEDWPLIHTVGVASEYRGHHLATKMIKKALSVLKSNYPVLRLFVTLGNAAESVYYELGFIPGVEYKKFYIPAMNRNDEF